LQIAKKLDYSPHPAARTLSVGSAGIKIGVCIPKEIRHFYDQDARRYFRLKHAA